MNLWQIYLPNSIQFILFLDKIFLPLPMKEDTGREGIETTCKIPYLLLDGLACRVIRKNSLGPWRVILPRAAKVRRERD